MKRALATLLLLVLSTSQGFGEIGTRTHAVTFNAGGTLEVFLTGLTQDEVNRIVPGSFDFLNIVQPFDTIRTRQGDSRACAVRAASNMLAYTGWGDTGDFQTPNEIYAFILEHNTACPEGGIHSTDAIRIFMRQYGNPALTLKAQPIILAPKPAILVDRLRQGYAITIGVRHYEIKDGVFVWKRLRHYFTVWGVVYDTRRDVYVGLLASNSENRLVHLPINWNSQRNAAIVRELNPENTLVWHSIQAVKPRPDYRQQLIRNYHNLKK
jgi:hypothetical protein